MLSKNELEFLKSPESFNSDYSRVLRCRIKAKTAQLHEQLALFEGSGLSVTENCNGITEFCNSKMSLNQVLLEICGAFGGIWTRDHYLTKVTPHRARLRRQMGFSLKEHNLGHKELTVPPAQKPKRQPNLTDHAHPQQGLRL